MLKPNKKNMKTINIPLMFTPIHMKGADEIAEVFSVARETVVQWAKEGAPIRMVGKRYQANYKDLWEWIKKKNFESGNILK